MIFNKKKLGVALSFFVILLSGCATYQNKVSGARASLAQRDYTKALEDLKSLALEVNGDQLVYLLDYAVALQVAGDLKESNRIFLQAEKLSESQDYHSVSRIAGSLVLNEEMVQYKGDTFEKIFINAYLAMNFLAMGDLDSALVEARRINEKFLKYRANEDKQYSLNPFGKYLSAVIWEANGSYDDAYIAYAESYKIDPTIAGIQADLIRSAKLARRMDSYADWKKKFPSVKEDPAWYSRKYGELIVVFQQGWGPRKIPDRGEYRFPDLAPVMSQTQKVKLTLQNKSYASELVYDVQTAAIKTLKEDQGILLAKRIAGIAAKAALSKELEQKDQALGQIAWLVMNMADRADLRQWSLLPQSIQFVRIPVLPGTYDINLLGENAWGVPTGEALSDQKVSVRPGKKSFVVWRSLK